MTTDRPRRPPAAVLSGDMRLLIDLAGLLIRGTALMVALASSVIGLACLGGAVSPVLDAFNHFAPFWLCLSLIGLFLGAFATVGSERKVIMGLSGFAMLIMAGLMAPELVAAVPPRSGPAAGHTLKVVQFNSWVDNDDPARSLAWIQAQDADVILLEESSGADAWGLRRELKKTHPYRVSCDGQRTCDTWILSRIPMVARRGFYEDEQGLAGAWATLRHPSGDFTVVATHFVWPVPAGPQQAQSRRLVQIVSRFPKASTIVAGDFNSTPWSFTLRRQDRALGMERRTRALATWPSGAFNRLLTAPAPLLPIDHVYAGSSWKTVKVERGPAIGSDHRPVVVTLVRHSN